MFASLWKVPSWPFAISFPHLEPDSHDFPITIDLPSLEFYSIVACAVFRIWLVSLGRMTLSSSLWLFVSGLCSFFLLSSIPLSGWPTDSLFHYRPMDTWVVSRLGLSWMRRLWVQTLVCFNVSSGQPMINMFQVVRNRQVVFHTPQISLPSQQHSSTCSASSPALAVVSLSFFFLSPFHFNLSFDWWYTYLPVVYILWWST